MLAALLLLQPFAVRARPACRLEVTTPISKLRVGASLGHDTMDAKPIQRSDISIGQQHRPSEELSDEELAARIAELEAEGAVH